MIASLLLRTRDGGGALAHGHDHGLAEDDAGSGHRRVHDLVEDEQVARGDAVGGAEVEGHELPVAGDGGVVLHVHDGAHDLAARRRQAVGRACSVMSGHLDLLEGLEVVAEVDVRAGLLDHHRGRVLLDEDDADPARGLDLGADVAARVGVLDRVGDVVEGVDVARP